MVNSALNEIIDRTAYYMAQNRAQLETEATRIARLQGELAGYKELMRLISSKFDFIDSEIEEADVDLGTPLTAIDCLPLAELVADWAELEKSALWAEVWDAIQANRSVYRDYLLMDAENSRALHITQGKYYGQTWYLDFFQKCISEWTIQKAAPELGW
jgi:hypothetical protein